MSEPTPSIEQLCRALSRLLGVTEPAMIADLKTINESERLLRSALDELVRLRALEHLHNSQPVVAMAEELAALRAQVAEQTARWERAEVVLREVTSDDDRLFCESVRCVFCGGLSWEHPSHKDDCPVVQARALLGGGGQ